MEIISATQQSLIRILADGGCHSGEEIGHRLGMSRSAVWKQLQKLVDFGLEVISLRGQGYRLSRKIDLLDQQLIYSALSSGVGRYIDDLDVLFAVDSTNDHALKKSLSLREGKAYVCFAEYQRKGRGRRGRQWVSPLACNIYCSFSWQFEEGAAVLEGLSLAVGVAVARVVERLAVGSVSLKWPNDILLEGKKLGGVLLEMTGDPAGRCQVVIGVGINVGMPEEQKIDQPWIALGPLISGVSRVQLAADITSQIVSLLSSYAKEGFAVYIAEWQALDAFLGRRVRVVSGSQETIGVACGVAGNGALLLEVDGIQQPFYAGELSLRLESVE
ncbi:MAG: BirA family biotin operon repressor/biotin-[acetyl-CoA-carboxylase] ligase [Cellvibrionaceae bacterium]